MRNVLKNYANSVQKMSVKSYSGQKLDDFFDPVIKANHLSPSFLPIVASSDGNCLYNSISTLMCGNQGEHDLIRLGVVYVILKFKEFRKIILKSEGYNSPLNYEQFVSKTIILGNWGDEYVLLALSVLLNRSLFCYSINPPPNLIASSVKYTSSLEHKTNYPVALALHGNHFIPLLPIDTKVSPPIPIRSNFGMIFKKMI